MIDWKYYSKKCTMYSVILTIMVVYIHALNYKVYPIRTEYGFLGKFVFNIEYLHFCISRVAVTSFLIISGFNFFKNYNYSKTVDKYKNRFRKLVIPYIFWQSIMWIYLVLLISIPQLKSAMNSNNKELSFISWLGFLIDGSETPLWYVKNLIIIVAISPLIYSFLKYKIGGIILFLILIFTWIFHPYDEFSILYSTIFYTIGGYFGIHSKKLFTNRITKRKSIVSLVLFIFLTAINYSFHVTDSINFGILYFIPYSLSGWYAFDILNLSKYSVNKYMKMSFLVYCGHYLLQETLEKLFLIIFGKSAFMALIDFLFMPIITIAIILCLGNLCREKVSRFYSLITGGR
ncbi:hypothetical protein JCM1393_07100 [Clostridium carnis]